MTVSYILSNSYSPFQDRTIRREISLQDLVADLISIRPGQRYQKEYENRVLHIAGTLTTGEPLTEPDYNIQVQAVKLRRRVFMYQWVSNQERTLFVVLITISFQVEESVDRIGSSPPEDVMDHDERQYFYATEWQEKLVDSTRFYLRSGHQNPPNFPMEAKTYVADHVKIGDFELNEDFKRSFSNFILITSDTRPDIPGVKLHSGFYYHCDGKWV